MRNNLFNWIRIYFFPKFLSRRDGASSSSSSSTTTSTFHQSCLCVKRRSILRSICIFLLFRHHPQSLPIPPSIGLAGWYPTSWPNSYVLFLSVPIAPMATHFAPISLQFSSTHSSTHWPTTFTICSTIDRRRRTRRWNTRTRRWNTRTRRWNTRTRRWNTRTRKPHPQTRRLRGGGTRGGTGREEGGLGQGDGQGGPVCESNPEVSQFIHSVSPKIGFFGFFAGS